MDDFSPSEPGPGPRPHIYGCKLCDRSAPGWVTAGWPTSFPHGTAAPPVVPTAGPCPPYLTNLVFSPAVHLPEPHNGHWIMRWVTGRGGICGLPPAPAGSVCAGVSEDEQPPPCPCPSMPPLPPLPPCCRCCAATMGCARRLPTVFAIACHPLRCLTGWRGAGALGPPLLGAGLSSARATASVSTTSRTATSRPQRPASATRTIWATGLSARWVLDQGHFPGAGAPAETAGKCVRRTELPRPGGSCQLPWCCWRGRGAKSRRCS